MSLTAAPPPPPLWKRLLKPIVVAARHAPERAAHSARRRKAVALLGTVQPGAVLFICHGNVCRSPYAAELFAREAGRVYGSMFSAHSAGFVGPDRGSPPEALAASRRRGIDLTRHCSQLVTPALIRSSTLVVVMSSRQERDIRRLAGAGGPPVVILGDLDPQPIRERTVLDPWGGGPEIFNASYERIDRCMAALVKALVPGDPRYGRVSGELG